MSLAAFPFSPDLSFLNFEGASLHPQAPGPYRIGFRLFHFQYIVCGIYTVFVMWSISFWEIRKLESSASTAGPDPFFFEDITRAMKDLCEQAGI